MIKDTSVSTTHKLRLVMMYALRYQKTQAANIANLINLLLANGVSREDARVSVYLLTELSVLSFLVAGICIFEHFGLRSTSRRSVFN